MGREKVEDYFGAFQARALDTDILYQAGRSVGTVHFGGIAIECLIKSIIIIRHGIEEWHTEYNNQLHGIKNPGHDLIQAFRLIPELRCRLKESPQLVSCLNILLNPIGNGNYINERYNGQDIPEERLKEWYNAYLSLRRWLLKNRTKLPISKKRRK